MTKFFTVLSIIIGGIVLITAWGVGQAWIIQRVWTWYMVGHFHFPPLRLSECYILVLAVRMIVPSSEYDSKAFRQEFWAKMAGSGLAWLTLLGIAWWLR